MNNIMVIFKGYINKYTLKYIHRKMIRIGWMSIFVEFIIFGVPSIVTGVMFKEFLFALWVFIILMPITFLIVWSTKDGQLPYLVRIEESEIYAEVGRGAGTRTLADVKKVLDYGEFYDIIFYFPNKVLNCICQKDLIVEGTIEEFEKLFEDKIMRKYKAKD